MYEYMSMYVCRILSYITVTLHSNSNANATKVYFTPDYAQASMSVVYLKLYIDAKWYF